MIKREDWKWYGFPGHFICADRCLFRLNTKVGKYLISTVGAMPRQDNSGKMENINSTSLFETMVFRVGAKEDKYGNAVKTNPMEVECKLYDDSRDAEKGHYEICEKYANKQ